jgi:hypothetical protein
VLLRQDESLPGDQRNAIISHLVHAHMGVVGYAQRFADTLRRCDGIAAAAAAATTTHAMHTLKSTEPCLQSLEPGLNYDEQAMTGLDVVVSLPGTTM